MYEPPSAHDFPPNVWVAERENPHLLQGAFPIDENPAYDQWAQQEEKWQTDFVLREFLGGTCRFVYQRDCGHLFVAKHRDTLKGTETKMNMHGCNHRGTCPVCAVGYGYSKGQQQYDIMRSVLEGRDQPLAPGDVAVWSVIPTLPKEVSWHLGRQITACAWPGRTISKLANKARDLAATHLFKVRKQDIQGALNIHFTSSTNPLSGWHIHFHIMIPNVTSDGRPVTGYRELPPDRLEAFRTAWWKYVSKLFPDEMTKLAERFGSEGRNEKLNFEIHYVKNDEALERKLRHHCLYDARHMLQDLRDYLMASDDQQRDVFSRKEAVTWFVEQSDILQSQKTRRWFGTLTPGKRTALGVFEKPSEDTDWYKPLDPYFTLERFTDDGAIFKQAVGAGVYHYQEVQMQNIQLTEMSAYTPWTTAYVTGRLVTDEVRKLRMFMFKTAYESKVKERIKAFEKPHILDDLKGILRNPYLTEIRVSQPLSDTLQPLLDYHHRPLSLTIDPGLSGYHLIWQLEGQGELEKIYDSSA
jgi:hypothetical protein